MNISMKTLGLLLMLGIITPSFADSLYPLETIQQRAQFQHLLKNLRCLVCQNQDLADSNAGLAKDLRNEVYLLVKNRQSDDEIINYLTSRYGEFILFNPPIKAITWLLWFGPLLFLLIGLLIFWLVCIKNKYVATRTVPTSRGMTPGSIEPTRSLDPAVKP